MIGSINIVLGTLFGDEGKGTVVNWLAEQMHNPIVVRFNGGHQAGHTVVHNGILHIFSNFGSATLQGVPTYWSKYCTVDPIGVQKEGDVLREHGAEPMLYLDEEAMITTPFDILQNLRHDSREKHGSVGVGFGQTVKRNEEYFHLYVRDLKHPKIFEEKLRLIKENYYFDIPFPRDINELIGKFKLACEELMDRYTIVNSLDGLHDYNLIFEGAQGIMLDQHYGFFPHVTRSNTTSKNALEIIKSLGYKPNIDTFYVTRAYQTRHGNGYMTNEDMDTSYINNKKYETNKDDGVQGKFRKSPLDLDMLHYALMCDGYHNPNTQKHMMVTCLDQVPEKFPVTLGGKVIDLYKEDWRTIPSFLHIHSSWGSYGQEGEFYTNHKDRL